ncbi:N-acetyltransferase family protein, partial [Staphylococcus arlettae]
QKLAKNEPVLVYVKDNEVVGFATYGSFRDWPAYKNTVEHSIYVDPKTRKEGIASKLLTELIKEIEYKGYKTIVAGIDANNEGSIKLHEKFNFVA